MTFGLRAAQVDSEAGRFYNGASAHNDLVIAKVFVPASVAPPSPFAGTTAKSKANMKAKKGRSPSGESNSSGRASQPAPLEERSDNETSIEATIASSDSSSSNRAAQPAPVFLKPATPRIKQIVGSDGNKNCRSCSKDSRSNTFRTKNSPPLLQLPRAATMLVHHCQL